MANEQLTMGNSVENSNENSFLSQLKNLKHAIEITATLLLAPIAVTGQTTADTTKVENNKAQIEVVQQDQDPVKDLMKKYNVNNITEVEMMDLKDMVSMLKEVYTLTASNKQLESSFKELTEELELSIKAEKPDINFLALKTGVGTISEEDNKRIEEKKALLAKVQAEVETKRNNIEELKKKTEEVKKETEEVKKVIEGLIGKQG